MHNATVDFFGRLKSRISATRADSGFPQENMHCMALASTNAKTFIGGLYMCTGGREGGAASGLLRCAKCRQLRSTAAGGHKNWLRQLRAPCAWQLLVRYCGLCDVWAHFHMMMATFCRQHLAIIDGGQGGLHDDVVSVILRE